VKRDGDSWLLSDSNISYTLVCFMFGNLFSLVRDHETLAQENDITNKLYDPAFSLSWVDSSSDTATELALSGDQSTCT
jgi:hypothetical protein